MTRPSGSSGRRGDGLGGPSSGAEAALPAGAPGRLFVVATPIGNLSDVTLRALETLAHVGLIAAEDTRLTRRLLARHEISNRLVSYHARNSATRLPDLVAALRGGTDIALVTDAGTPSISDPGGELVAAWAAEGGVVVPIPGPSASLAALVASGVAGPRWIFEGFLPRSGRERRERLARLAEDPRSSIVYEAPGRVAATLRDLAHACGVARPAAVCRELTKIHESIYRGTLGQLASQAVAGEIPARGEFVIVVGEVRGPGAPAASGSLGVEAAEALAIARAEVDRLVEAGVPRGEATRRVAAATGIGRRALYKAPV